VTRRTLAKRLERLETRLAESEQQVLRIEVTRVGGGSEKIIELHLRPPGRRQARQGQETTGGL
jgi:hypothetical protein